MSQNVGGQDAVTQDAAVLDADAASTVDDIRVVTQNVTAEESAAVIAVVATAIDEIRAEGDQLPDARPRAWENSRRRLREPLVRGTWRPFNG